MSGETLDVYRHSGKYTLPGLILPVAAAAAIGFPAGLAYSYLIRWIPFVYINFFITLGYGFGFGWLATQLLKIGQVRNTLLATLAGIACGLCALYWEWNGHLHAMFEDAPWFFRPDQIGRGMAYLYEHGSWSFHNNTVSGIPLALVWLIEAGIIVGCAAMIPFGFVATTPFCEKTRTWLEEERKIDTLEAFTDAGQIGALEAGDLQPIIAAKPRAPGSTSFARLSLKRSPRCPHFCTLRIQNVFTTIDSKGNASEKVQELTRDFIIPPSLFDLITQFEGLKPPGPV